MNRIECSVNKCQKKKKRKFSPMQIHINKHSILFKIFDASMHYSQTFVSSCVKFYENETKCFINSGFFFISNFISWLVPLSTYIVYTKRVLQTRSVLQLKVSLTFQVH